MIHYRPFLNWDPPAIAEIWRHQAPNPGRMQPVTSVLLEELVFSKPYFDREGFIVAVDGARPVGFVHVTSGSNAEGTNIDPQIGVIAMLLVEPSDQAGEITIELVGAAVDYLRKRGARKIIAGCAPPHDPFYLGLYGGATTGGILADEKLLIDVLTAEKFVAGESWQLWRCSLADFRPPIDRQQRQLRLKYEVATTVDPATESWWEACQWGPFIRTRYDLVPRGGGVPVVSTWMWDVIPLSRTWGRHATGFIRWNSHPGPIIPGASAFLAAEILVQLQQEQIALVTAVTHSGEKELFSLYQSLGFEVYANGATYEKSGDSS